MLPSNRISASARGTLRVLSLATALISITAALPAKQLSILSLPNGYAGRSLELGQEFAGAIAQDPANPDRLFVSAGSFGGQFVLSVNTATGTTAPMTSALGSIGGIAVLTNGDLAITENYTSDTILRARDLNTDGDFLDAGEVTELIAPILTGGNFTGAQTAVAPAGNASQIPAGSLLYQTADGAGLAKLFVIENPNTAPAFRPSGSACYAGAFAAVTYNGGFAFDAAGNIIYGMAEMRPVGFSLFGRIMALVNTNGDQMIGPGEANTLVSDPHLDDGLTDLAVSNEGRVFYSSNSATVWAFALPADLLTGTATPAPFVRTDAAYISAVRFDFPGRTFAAGSTGTTARLYVGGLLAPMYESTTNLLVIEPAPFTAAKDWNLYR